MQAIVHNGFLFPFGSGVWYETNVLVCSEMQSLTSFPPPSNTHTHTPPRLMTLHFAPSPTPDLLHLLANISGLLGLDPPNDDSSTPMAGLMGQCQDWTG